VALTFKPIEAGDVAILADAVLFHLMWLIYSIIASAAGKEV
jgi:hypothetical protein